MTNRIFIRKRAQLSILLLGFLLFGCATAPKAPHQTTGADQPAAGDVEKGRALFMGNQHLQNGGPSCMGCHSVGSNGLLGGGALGPNLTDVTERLKADDLSATLGGTAKTLSPVMLPIYAEHPLTAAEQADLTAFMAASVGQPETDHELLLLGISTVGFFGVVIAIQIIHRKRLRGVRRPLVDAANARKR